jgi:putative DNA primase/helicase
MTLWAASEQSADPIVQLINGANITPMAIDWLWHEWIAAGKLHILAGAPGTGKTTLALALAAALTVAGRWPDGSRISTPGDVLIWSGEDDATDTLAPRLLACGADMARIHFVGSVRESDEVRPFDPAKDLHGLAEAARRVGNVRLLICDPVVSAVTGDSHKNTEVRRALQPLVDLGHEINAAVLGISHFSKGSQGRDPTERVVGSLAFGALARVVLAAAKMQDEDGKRILARSKSNIGPDDGGFHYDIEQIELAAHPGVWASRVLWGEAIEGSAREILAAADAIADQDGEPEDSNEVDAWLRGLLTDTGEMRKREVIQVGKECGFAERTIQHARKRIGAMATIHGFGSDKHAVWSLPNRANNQSMRANPKNYGTNGTNDDEGSIVPIVPLDLRCTPSGTNGGTNDDAPSWAAGAGVF